MNELFSMVVAYDENGMLQITTKSADGEITQGPYIDEGELLNDARIYLTYGLRKVFAQLLSKPAPEV